MSKSKNIQLNLSKRQVIENMLANKMSATDIARTLHVHKSSISREIFKYRTLYYVGDKSPSICSHCLNRPVCKLKHRCGRALCATLCLGCSVLNAPQLCDRYRPIECSVETRFPFICTSCSLSNVCKRSHFRYSAIEANQAATAVKVQSREGLNMTPAEFTRMDQIVKDGLANHQSIYHIAHAFKDEINRSPKTLYTYINKHYLSSVRLDLPRAVCYKKRIKTPQKYEYRENVGIDRSNRLYRDWLVFQSRHRIIDYWEIDFLGAPANSLQEILVFTIPRLQFVLLFPLASSSKELVILLFNRINLDLAANFSRVFPAILTDRDPAFNDFLALETDPLTGELRTNIFYCDPHISNQKPSVENINGQIRIIFPKGVCLSNITLEQCYLLSSHLNARILHSLNDTTPTQMFIDIFGIEMLRSLHLEVIDSTKVSLKSIR